MTSLQTMKRGARGSESWWVSSGEAGMAGKTIPGVSWLPRPRLRWQGQRLGVEQEAPQYSKRSVWSDQAESGRSAGWEGGALFVVSLLLLSFGLVTLYSASAGMAQTAGLPDYFFVIRQAGGDRKSTRLNSSHVPI